MLGITVGTSAPEAGFIPSPSLEHLVDLAGSALEAAGVLVVVLGVLVATLSAGRKLATHAPFDDTFVQYRRGLGRAILLGLEFLMAGDIIRTVVVSPSFGSVGVLALIVLIRTFLSFTLEVEIEGRWPWQSGNRNQEERPL